MSHEPGPHVEDDEDESQTYVIELRQVGKGEQYIENGIQTWNYDEPSSDRVAVILYRATIKAPVHHHKPCPTCNDKKVIGTMPPCTEHAEYGWAPMCPCPMACPDCAPDSVAVWTREEKERIIERLEQMRKVLKIRPSIGEPT